MLGLSAHAIHFKYAGQGDLMGYYVDHMIGLRTGGVFSGATDLDDISRRIAGIVEEQPEYDAMRAPIGVKDGRIAVSEAGYGSEFGHCMSHELVASKGTMVVLAGVFNYWSGEAADWFCGRLSEEFGCEVFHMEHDEQTGDTRCNIWLDGRSLWDVNEDPIGRVLRRTT
jgi:hypothetical protein